MFTSACRYEFLFLSVVDNVTWTQAPNSEQQQIENVIRLVLFILSVC